MKVGFIEKRKRAIDMLLQNKISFLRLKINYKIQTFCTERINIQIMNKKLELFQEYYSEIF